MVLPDSDPQLFHIKNLESKISSYVSTIFDKQLFTHCRFSSSQHHIDSVTYLYNNQITQSEESFSSSLICVKAIGRYIHVEAYEVASKFKGN